MDPIKLKRAVAMNAAPEAAKIEPVSSESSCLPSLKGSSSSEIRNEYPSPMKRTRRLHTANTLMLTGQKVTEGTRDSGGGISAPWDPQT